MLAAVAVLAAPLLHAQTPEWIWHDNKGAPPGDNEVRVFRKTFTVPGAATKARLTAAGDNHIVVWLNGHQVAASDDWTKPTTKDVTPAIQPGANVLAAYGRNDSGAAAILVHLELTFADGRKQTVVSDTSWLASAAETPGWEKPGFATTGWTQPVSLGKLGVAPWGDVLADGAAQPRATPAESLKVLDGFRVELLRSAAPGEGSWICMAIDSQGRLIISPQGPEPMLRFTLAPEGRVAKIEPIHLPARTAMGLLYAFDSLYVDGRGKDGLLALFRLRDTNGDDQYDSMETIFRWSGGGGEHGSHGVVLGPDQKLYIVHGNFVNVPANLAPASPHRNYADDLILDRMEDGNGFGAGKKPPGGFILRLDPDGKNPELFAAGQRNDYDIAFSPDGELFGFDSDMEWDWGLPWYRPIRINHLVSGGDYGFREGSAKWPNWYPDSLPTTLDVGIGSPTGMKFGTDSRFPGKYQRALFAMDWSYGRIFAVHLTPQGATYSATAEVFLQGRPLNVTDFEFGKDGAMYFITGGRGTQSGLYRVSYAGPASRPAPSAADLAAEAKGAEARALRHKLEAFHGRRDPAALDFAWPHLNSDDRWIRYAARIAVESQPVAEWQTRALEEERVNASLTALLALARYGDRALQKDLLQALGRLPADQLSEDQLLAALRVCEVCCSRMGRPDPETSAAAIERLDALYPAPSEPLNRELCQLLVYLQAPDVVSKTLALLDRAPTQEEQIFYVFTLRKLNTGWTPAQRRHYFSWFNQNRAGLPHTPRLVEWFRDTGQEYHDGASFPKFFAHIKSDAVASLSDAERAELKSIIERQAIAPKPPAVPRKFVKEWKMEDLLPALDEVSHGRSFERGRTVFNDAQCIACHRFGDAGGSVGPDLTAVGSRFTVRDILDSILEPSKVVSEQYQNTTILKKNGDDVTGRVVEEDDQKVIVVTDPLKNETTEIRNADIQRRVASKVSPMPEGLVNLLTKDEILDLLAYLESGGNAQNAAFGK